MSQTSIETQQRRQWVAAWCRTYGANRKLVRFQASVSPRTQECRSLGDAQAAWQRWHDASADAGFGDQEWPWYAILERARVETLASLHLPGMASNLVQLEELSPVDPSMARLYRAARHSFIGNENIDLPILVSDDRNSNSSSANRTWSLLGLIRLPGQPLAETQEIDEKVDLSDSEIVETLHTARNFVDNGMTFAESIYPLVIALASRAGVNQESFNPAADSLDQAQPESDNESDEEHSEATFERPGAQLEEVVFDEAFPRYAVFTRQWDEEDAAIRWFQAEDAVALKALNDLDRRRVRQLAHRLQRRLMAARLRTWSFDQEEGRLDSRRLARLIGPNPNHRIFRVENEAPTPEACVTFLVDQSGSMRGERRRMAALAIDLAVHTLETCQVSCEVLGFTTRFSADNAVTKRWRQVGSPAAPGRLNALRHIRYKSPEQPWRRVRSHLGLLLREGFGHENLDGEALHWAARRLLHKPQARKVLVVLSDGAPHDADTVRANGRGFLDSHLREVIGQIEASPIRLVAIGTGQDVGRFYRHAVTVRRPDAVAEILFDCLGKMLTDSQSEGTSL